MSPSTDSADAVPFFDAMGETTSRRAARSWSMGLPGRGRTGTGMRCVLVLQGNVALWTRWQDGQRVAERVERLSDEAMAATRCPWPTTSTPAALDGVPLPATVEPVELDASEPVDAAGQPEVPMSERESVETFVDVVADSPLDDIERALSSESNAEGAVRESERFAAGRLLRAVRQRALVRRLAGEYPDAAIRLAPVEAAPVLAVLLRSELPEAWTRRLQALQRGAVTVRVIHSAIRLRRVAADERAGDVLRVYRGGGMERHVLYRGGCPTFTRLIAQADRAVATTALDDTCAHLLAHHAVSDPRIVQDDAPAEAVSQETYDIADARELASLALASRPVGGSRDVPSVLDKWLRHIELRRLHVAAALTALIAGLTVIASVVYGIGSMQRRAEASRASEALAERASSLSAALDARHPTPAVAEASLVRIDRRSAAAPDPAELLGSLAGVLTAHPDIRLERLTWSSGDGQDLADDMPLDLPASLPARRVDGELEPAVTRVEIAGRIDVSGDASGKGGKVRERQSRFEAFVGALGDATAFDQVEVRLSPATAAASGDAGQPSSARAGSGGTHYALGWRHSSADARR